MTELDKYVTGDNILYMDKIASKITLLTYNFVEFLINY
jgi:hypothetical protein